MLLVLKHAVFVDALIVIGLLLLTQVIKPRFMRGIGQKVAVMALIIPVVGFLSPGFWALNLVALLLIPLIAKSRADVAGLLIVGLLMIPAIGQSIVIGPLYLLPFNVQGSLSLGALIAANMHRSKGSGVPLRYDASFFIIFGLMVFLGSRDTSFTNALRATADNLLTYGLPYFIFTRSVRSTEDLQAAVQYFMMATLLIAFILVYEARTSWPLYQAMVDHYGRNLMSGMNVHIRSGYLRAGGPFLEATTMAFVMSLGASSVWAMRSTFKTTLAHKIAMGVICLAILASQSRGGMLGVVLSVTTIEIYRKQARRALAVGLAVMMVFAGMIAISVGKSGVGAYFSGSAERGKDEQEYRVRLFHRGLQEVVKSPIIGESSSTVNINMRDMVQGEGIIDFVNTYLFMAIFAGLIGVMLFMIAIFYPQSLLWRARNAALGLPLYRELGPFLAGSSFAASVQFFFTAFTGGHLRVVLLLLGLSGALSHRLRQEQRRRRSEQEDAVAEVQPEPVLA